MPIGNATLLLMLLLSVEAGLGLLLIREHRWRAMPATRATSEAEVHLPIDLRRRTMPQLRAHRPFFIVEEQVRWRRAAEASRRRRADAG